MTSDHPAKKDWSSPNDTWTLGPANSARAYIQMDTLETPPDTPPKINWDPGPWQDEPDRVQWTHRGYVCLARRNMRHGMWCGYIGLPPGHPWHGQHYNNIDAECHGGLTYSKPCDDDPHTGICHVSAPGEPETLWWIGFDCAHFDDRKPGFEAQMRAVDVPSQLISSDSDIYRDLHYVRRECESLVEQAKKAAS